MQRVHVLTGLLGGLQWLFFMFANTVVIPLSVGAAFQLSGPDMASSIQRSFVYTGIACCLQAFWGHRLAIMEGQSGLWWGVILSLNAMTAAGGGSFTALGGALSVGIVVSGVALAALGALGIGKWLQKWFTPVVMGVFLLLLAVQLTTIFCKGMIGLADGATINLPVTALSLALVVLVVILSLKGRGLVSNFAILIGIVAGWIAYAALFPERAGMTGAAAGLLAWFPYGRPVLDWGLLFTTVLTGLINTTNTVASLKGAEQLYGRPTTDAQYRRSFVLSGVNAVVSGLFGLVPYAPYTSSLGFLRSTRILERVPFVFGACMFTLLGLVPAFSRFFSTLPISVGDAVLFVAYLQLFGAALQNIEGIRFDFKTIYRIAGPVLAGIAIMNMPPSVFATLPALVRPLLGNGLLVGILLSVLLENGVNWDKLR